MRNPKIVILSDLHLGTYGSHAAELVSYLSEVNPEILILNGDIIDIWQFKKKYFPPEHFKVLQCILNKILSGTCVYYLTGNHDDMLRRFGNISLGNFHLREKLTLMLNNKKYWIFHGDVFDSSIKHARWIAKLGGKAYDHLIRLNRLVNSIRSRFDLPPVSISKRIKSNVKEAVKFIGDFEETALDLAIKNGYDYVICGHIHTPTIRTHYDGQHAITYMNSGDWVENLTSLEFENDEWTLYDHLSQQHRIVPLNKSLELEKATAI
ncbi:MAG: UDP-2,3-diacylglucosamine diphosphatase [Saprospiraceae bacterium]|nr:UDP-2,3-diacylglucosamine diphosphatase [Saprospiraceae bacterium]